MSESDSGKPLEGRLAPPFPSRHELHSAAIPQVPQPVKPPESEARAPSAPVRREPPRRPRSALPTPVEEPQTQQNAPETATAPPFLPVQEAEDSGQVHSGFLPVQAKAAKPEAAHPPYPKRSSMDADSQTDSIRTRVQSADVDQRKKRRRKRRIWTVLIALFILAGVGVAAYWALTNMGSASKPLLSSDDYPPVDWEADPVAHPVVEVTVEPGQLGSDIGANLVEAGVVKSTGAFTRAFDANPAASSIKPGTYTLPTEIPAVEALAALLDETNRSENSITVNPGQTASQVAEKMVSVVGFSQEDVEAILEDPSDVTALPKQAGGDLEGWLWAGAYEFSPADTPADVFNKMVEPTVAYLEDNNVPEDQWEETLIRASIVEREVNRTEDMPKVAQVIENRISDEDGPTRGMLQMDSTVTYGVGGTGGLPDSAAFADDNPYNTYIVKGLPVGPIATPSTDAIQAVLHPEEGNWLYFVTVNLDTGETIFTDSHEELGELTDQLIAWCEENPDECKSK